MPNILKSFSESDVCQSAVKSGGTASCVFCRLRMDWQNAQAGTDYTNPRDTICPLKFKLGEAPPAVLAKAQAQQGAPKTDDPNVRPPVTAAQAASFLQAMLISRRVSDEVEAERVAICNTCDKRGTDGKTSWCNVCGCGVGADVRSILNLAHYEENLPKWGCKHPLRRYRDPAGKLLGWLFAPQSAPTK
jgi:hypothetical protein